MKLKLHKLTIVIFTIILCIFYLQIVSCKSNEDPPVTVYSNYTGYVDPFPYEPSMYDTVKHKYRKFIVNEKEKYNVMVQSDIDKLNGYASLPQPPEITIKATYSNNYLGYKRGYEDDYLFDITVIEK